MLIGTSSVDVRVPPESLTVGTLALSVCTPNALVNMLIVSNSTAKPRIEKDLNKQFIGA